jgi:hypothetical protein
LLRQLFPQGFADMHPGWRRANEEDPARTDQLVSAFPPYTSSAQVEVQASAPLARRRFIAALYIRVTAYHGHRAARLFPPAQIRR